MLNLDLEKDTRQHMLSTTQLVSNLIVIIGAIMFTNGRFCSSVHRYIKIQGVGKG